MSAVHATRRAMQIAHATRRAMQIRMPCAKLYRTAHKGYAFNYRNLKIIQLHLDVVAIFSEREL